MSKNRRVVAVFLPRIFFLLVLLLDLCNSIAWNNGDERERGDSGAGDRAETVEEEILHTGHLNHKADTRIRKYASSTDPNTDSYDDDDEGNAKTENVKAKILNVHVVPHTHDDVGWLKTIDQYYNGRNETIQVASVRDILDSVIEALSENPSRTFVYAEIKFFQMWWEEQTNATQQRVRDLVVVRKQLSFVNGGWCMHDEATTHFIGMIDQTTLGHDFLRRTFGYVPTVGWQLDPFGHSSSQASLMTRAMGFDALYFGRIDYQDLERRRATKDCEGLWNTAPAAGLAARLGPGLGGADGNQEDRSVFWGLTGSYRGQYGPPDGVCFDPTNCSPDEYVPLTEMNRTGLASFVEKFLMALRAQSDQTQGDHIMVTMGEDFRYQKASVNFSNLDLLLGTIARLKDKDDDENDDVEKEEDREIDIPSLFGPEYDRVNIFYSSPEYYTFCKYNETIRSSREERHGRFSDVEPFSPSISKGRKMSLETQHSDALIPITPIASDQFPNEALTTTRRGVEWSVKHDDFFPYSDCPHCFWTGYYASRPSLKRFERVGSSFLLAIRQVESTPLDTSANASSPLLRKSVDNNDRIDDDELLCGPQRMHKLEDALGVLQHHDGVSGTSKQHVAYDYAKRLQEGINAVLPCTIRKLKRLLLGRDKEDKHLNDLAYCQLLNETRCDTSVNATRSDMDNNGTNESLDLYIVVYNSLAFERSVVIDLPVGTNGTFQVEALEDGANSSEILVETNPILFQSSLSNHDGTSQNGNISVLSFVATSLPAVGAKVFRVRRIATETLNSLGKNGNNPDSEYVTIMGKSKEESSSSGSLQKISNGHFTVLLDANTGDIFRTGSKGIESVSSWGYYTSFDSEKEDGATNNGSTQNSGAYVFRPSTLNQELKIIPAKNATIIQTSLGTEIHTEYEEPWIRTVAKILTGMPYLEIEYQVGPIPIGDGRGKEVVTRYSTMVDNHGVFYTDSNGREFLKRTRNHRPSWNLTVFEPIAGNYYPINTAIYVDETNVGSSTDRRKGKNLGRTPPAFAVVTDRSHGGGSVVDGTVELMVHRRTLADDARGVGEPINETAAGIDACPPYGNAARFGEGLVIRGKHRIIVENNNNKNYKKGSNASSCTGNNVNDDLNCGGFGGARLARSLMDTSFAEPLVFVGTALASVDIPFHTTSFSGVKEPLPKNVMLVTKKLWYEYPEPNTYLVRLAHQYGVGEDFDLSRPVDVDLSILFPGQRILGIRETTLSGNRAVEDWRKERFDWTEASRGRYSGEHIGRSKERTTIITLIAMDIRTFVVRLGE